jgi:hypothetical protein
MEILNSDGGNLDVHKISPGIKTFTGLARGVTAVADDLVAIPVRAEGGCADLALTDAIFCDLTESDLSFEYNRNGY